MSLLACTREPCTSAVVLHAAGLDSVTCEGKGSCWLIALLASFEGLINNPRNLSLRDRAVDLCGRQDVLDRLLLILKGSDDQLGGLLHAAGVQLRKVFRQLLQLPQATSRRRGGATAAWYTMEEDGALGGWQGDLCYQVLAQYAPSNPVSHTLLPVRASSMLPCNTRELTFTLRKALHSHRPPCALHAFALCSHMHCWCAECSGRSSSSGTALTRKTRTTTSTLCTCPGLPFHG
jgi:hypothetical protein